MDTLGQQIVIGLLLAIAVLLGLLYWKVSRVLRLTRRMVSEPRPDQELRQRYMPSQFSQPNLTGLARVAHCRAVGLLCGVWIDAPSTGLQEHRDQIMIRLQHRHEELNGRAQGIPVADAYAFVDEAVSIGRGYDDRS